MVLHILLGNNYKGGLIRNPQSVLAQAFLAPRAGPETAHAERTAAPRGGPKTAHAECAVCYEPVPPGEAPELP